MQTSSIFTNSEITNSKNAENTAKSSLEKLHDEMSDAAAKTDLDSEDDVMDLLSEMRNEELYARLKKGLEDIEKGNTRPFSEALSDIKSHRNKVNESDVVEKYEELQDEIAEQIELARNQGWLAGTVEGACSVIRLLKLSREESIDLLARACRLSNLTATDMYEKLLK